MAKRADDSMFDDPVEVAVKPTPTDTDTDTDEETGTGGKGKGKGKGRGNAPPPPTTTAPPKGKPLTEEEQRKLNASGQRLPSREVDQTTGESRVVGSDDPLKYTGSQPVTKPAGFILPSTGTKPVKATDPDSPRFGTYSTKEAAFARLTKKLDSLDKSLKGDPDDPEDTGAMGAVEAKEAQVKKLETQYDETPFIGDGKIRMGNVRALIPDILETAAGSDAPISFEGSREKSLDLLAEINAEKTQLGHLKRIAKGLQEQRDTTDNALVLTSPIKTDT